MSSKVTKPGAVASAIAFVALAWGLPCAAEQPALPELKAIAEEAYLYGFPMIVGCKVLHDYNVDRDSGQFKAPFNEIHNEARVYTPRDTASAPPTATRSTPRCRCTCAPLHRSGLTAPAPPRAASSGPASAC